jgi:hypothetical protein
MSNIKDAMIQDQAVASTFRHFGYRDGLAGNVCFPPETKQHQSAYLEGYEIGNADRQDEARIARAETETD